MSVEYIPFDPTLIGKEEIIIWCSSGDDYGSLMRQLEECGVCWVSGTRPTLRDLWTEGSSNTFHVGRDKRMSRGGRTYFEDSYSCGTFMKWPPEQEVTADVGDLI